MPITPQSMCMACSQAEGEFPKGAAYAMQNGNRRVFATPLLIEGVAIGVTLIRRLEVLPLTDKQIALLDL